MSDLRQLAIAAINESGNKSPRLAALLMKLAACAACQDIDGGPGSILPGFGIGVSNGGALPATISLNIAGPAVNGNVITLVGGVPTWVAPPAVTPAVYGEIFALMPGDNPNPVAPGIPVMFPQTKALVGGVTAISSGLGVGPTQDSLVLPLTGRWLLSAQVSVLEPAQFVIWAQSGGVGPYVKQLTTVVGAADTVNQYMMSVIYVNAAAGTVVNFRNGASAAAVTITPIAGGTDPVSANFRAEYLGP